MKPTLQLHHGLKAATTGIAATLLALASVNTVSAQLHNTTNGPNATVTNGAGAGANMTTGDDNSAYGFSALQLNKNGLRNTVVGSLALKNNTAGSYNTAVGYGTLRIAVSSHNTALGYAVLFNNTTGTLNTAVGNLAMFNNTDGQFNVAVGNGALNKNTTADSNVAIGSNALAANLDGSFNTATGNGALNFNTTGGGNTATGNGALQFNQSGAFNTASGTNALKNNQSGSFNLGLGFEAGQNILTGTNNIYIGNPGVSGENNTIRIGKSIHQDVIIPGLAGRVISGGVQLLISAGGQLGIAGSSRRFKEDIADMADASAALLSLRPVTFRYKTEYDSQGMPQFGLIAEEVNEVNPDLVARDAKGEILTVRYEAVNAMLLNEFLKEHRRVEELKQRVSELEARDKARDARLTRLEAALDNRPARAVNAVLDVK